MLRLRHVGRRGAGRGAHDEFDHGREEERLLTRLGMSEYYGSEGFGPLAAGPPPDVCSYGAWRLHNPLVAAISAMTGLGRDP